MKLAIVSAFKAYTKQVKENYKEFITKQYNKLYPQKPTSKK